MLNLGKNMKFLATMACKTIAARKNLKSIIAFYNFIKTKPAHLS